MYCEGEVTGFTLVELGTTGDITVLNNGDMINYNCDINIRADVICEEEIGCVEFRLNGNTYRVENIAPYALGGDNSGSYHKLKLSKGEYYMEAIPWSGANKSGVQGTSKIINFTISDHFGNTSSQCWSEQIHQKRTKDENDLFDNQIQYITVYPNPFKDQVTIEFSLTEATRVKLEILSMDGRVMDVLFDSNADSNQMYKVNYFSKTMANGMYFSRLITETGEIHIRKLILIK